MTTRSALRRAISVDRLGEFGYRLKRSILAPASGVTARAESSRSDIRLWLRQVLKRSPRDDDSQADCE
jgi:hypothetical protein